MQNICYGRNPSIKNARRLFLTICIIISIIQIPAAAAANTTGFNWNQISPSKELHWVPCFPGQECASLEVPLDYSDPSGDKAAIALLRVKANVSSDSKEYRGPVLFNPGGPGGSGVSFINQFGERFQQLLGNEYDIVGFDPRGIGATTPPVSIFSNEIERALWNAGNTPLLNSTPEALSQSFFRNQLFDDLVEARSKQVAENVGTAVVARDMLSIMKAHGRDRLQYWGFSYGSVIGATYAAMFPNNVERLIIDGVVDFDDYYSAGFSKSLLDTDKVLQFFYDKCASAGPACALHANSSALVQQRLENILESIKEHPIPAINGSQYALIDFSTIKLALFNALYTPFQSLAIGAEIFAALEQGDGLPALAAIAPILPECGKAPPFETPTLEAELAVGCGDQNITALTIPEVFQHFEELSQISIFADVWTDMTWTACANWKVRAKERFAGPFAVNTSFPLLAIGNTADPVTPLVGAQKAANTFGGAALLTINTPGHSSLAATSPCAQEVIRSYFRDGRLPANGTICEIEDVLFGNSSASSRTMGKRDVKLPNRFHAFRNKRFL